MKKSIIILATIMLSSFAYASDTVKTAINDRVRISLPWGLVTTVATDPYADSITFDEGYDFRIGLKASFRLLDSLRFDVAAAKGKTSTGDFETTSFYLNYHYGSWGLKIGKLAPAFTCFRPSPVNVMASQLEYLGTKPIKGSTKAIAGSYSWGQFSFHASLAQRGRGINEDLEYSGRINYSWEKNRHVTIGSYYLNGKIGAAIAFETRYAASTLYVTDDVISGYLELIPFPETKTKLAIDFVDAASDSGHEDYLEVLLLYDFETVLGTKPLAGLLGVGLTENLMIMYLAISID